MIFNGFSPVLFFQVLVQLKLVVDWALPSGKLLVLPGIGCCDAIGPHGEERHWAWSQGQESRSEWIRTLPWSNTSKFVILFSVDFKLSNFVEISILYVYLEDSDHHVVPFALSWGWVSSAIKRGFLLSGSGESGESLITSDSWSSLSNRLFSLESKEATAKCYLKDWKTTAYSIKRNNRISGLKYSPSPFWFLPAFIFCLLVAIFLRPVFPLLSLPPSLLSFFLFWRFTAAGDDAVQDPLVSVRGGSVSFH